MTLGNIIYNDYLKKIKVDSYSIYYDAFDNANTEEIHSIIRCIDEKYKILLYYEPDNRDLFLLDKIQIGDKITTNESFEISKYLTKKLFPVSRRPINTTTGPLL